MSDEAFNTLTMVISVIAILLSFSTWRLERKAEEKREEEGKEREEIRKQIDELELIKLLHKANVVIYLETIRFVKHNTSGRASNAIRHRISIKNVGSAEAKNINISIRGLDESVPDESADNYIKPIDILGSGMEMQFSFTANTNRYIADWSWENPNGEKIEKTSNLSL